MLTAASLAEEKKKVFVQSHTWGTKERFSQSKRDEGARRSAMLRFWHLGDKNTAPGIKGAHFGMSERPLLCVAIEI